MYHEVAIVNGVLCHRHQPRGEWTPMKASAVVAYFEGQSKACLNVITTEAPQ